MVTTKCYKVIDLSPHDDDSPAHIEDVLNRQAEAGWELVTSFQRTHKALQVGSMIAPVLASSARCWCSNRMTHRVMRTEGPREGFGRAC